MFNIRNKKGSYQLDFYDTASPENWTLLTPNVIILCYDISSRLSLINIQRLVRSIDILSCQPISQVVLVDTGNSKGIWS